MHSKHIHVVFFSPTGTTLSTAKAITRGTGRTMGETVDLTTASLRDILVFNDTDLVVVGMPVYSGRIPALAVDRLKRIRGSNTPVVPVVVYGNRHYDDSLLELCDICGKQGFYTVAAGAFIGEHSFSTPDLPLSKGRPDATDLQKAQEFGKKIQISPLAIDCIPGNRPYRAEIKPKGCVTSVNSALCTNCQKCIKGCPSQSMRMTENGVTPNPEKCIWCMACLRNCPTNAQVLIHEKVKASAQKMNRFFNERREPETFVASSVGGRCEKGLF